MGLDASLSIATSGLTALQAEIAVASQNVANANTAGYAVEQSSTSSRTADGQASGVVVGLTTRTINTALENSLYTQNATVSALTTTSSGLTTISALQGSTSSDSGSSNTLPDQIGNLQSSLITLEADPSSAPSQQAVVSRAGVDRRRGRDRQLQPCLDRLPVEPDRAWSRHRHQHRRPRGPALGRHDVLVERAIGKIHRNVGW